MIHHARLSTMAVDRNPTAAPRIQWKKLPIGIVSTFVPHVQISIMVPVLVGMTIALHRWPNTLHEWMIPVSVALYYMGAVSALNHYFDLKRDVINHPNRLLSMAAVPLSIYFVVFVGLVTLAGIALLACVSTRAGFLEGLVLFAVIEGLHLVYGLKPNLGWKGFARQFLLGLGYVILVLFGGAVAKELTVTLFWCALAVGWYAYFAMTVKDVIDIVGDKQGNLQTIPANIGNRQTGIVSAIGIVPAFGIVAYLIGCGSLAATTAYYLVVAGVLFGTNCACIIRNQYGKYWGIPMSAGFLSGVVFMFGILMGSLI